MNNEKISGIEKAAIYLLNLPQKEAESVLQYLDKQQIQLICQKMSELKNIDNNKLDDVMQSFVDSIGTQTEIGIDNETQVKKMITGALGEKNANPLLSRVFKNKTLNGLDSLKWVDSKDLANLIGKEHFQIQAIILSYLGPEMAAKVLSHFDNTNKYEIISRISQIELVNPKALEQLNAVIEKELTGISTDPCSDIGGIKLVANILNSIDSKEGEEIINKLIENNPELSQQIQEQMFIFENILDIEDKGIQTLLREISTDQLVVALKGTDEEIKEKIFKNMSKRAGDLLKDDMEAKGAVKISEVESAQKEILAIAKKLADSGGDNT